MATKKQKRQAALEKHERMMAEYRRTGLEAQRRDQKRRAAKKAQAEADAEKHNKETSSKQAMRKLKGTFVSADNTVVDLPDAASLEMECI